MTGMLDSRQQAYFDAMGITTWVLRDQGQAEQAFPRAAPALKLGPGDGGTLMVCATDAEAAGSLASDISRALSGVPVWAWPVEAEDGRVTLEQAVSERLFTNVAIFGAELAATMFPGSVPHKVQTASLVQLPSIPDLEQDGQARRGLWLELCRCGIMGAA
ncbi:MAG: hypothetical protein PVF89_07350 [Lysobacterales bacterium]|jgi:DNA polymerase III psi subunit